MAGMVLGYWNFRGFGESCRYILEYCNCKYEDKQYPKLAPNDYENWRSIAHTFGFDFPNLPYLIDGEKKLTESVAIMKYIGRKYGLFPEDEDEMIRADVVEGVVLEYRTKFYDVFFVPKEKFKDEQKEFLNNRIIPLFEKMVKFMGERRWIISDKITYLDFMFYACLSQTAAIYPTAMEKFERLKKYTTQFQALPGIERYLKSDRFAVYPEHDPYIRAEYKL